MISADRIGEIAALPSQRDLADHEDREANYRVGKLMAEAIRELLKERLDTLLQKSELIEALVEIRDNPNCKPAQIAAEALVEKRKGEHPDDCPCALGGECEHQSYHERPR